ncbi:chaperonin 10-like protein [Mycena latifolia]|nr:chaperonin 10-like protein [Mycena latifolia]
MLAAVYQPGNDNLVLDHKYPIRQLEDNEVLLKVAAAGVCHTDVTLLSGVALDTRKYILGHEGCGVPIKLGSKVDKHAIRERQLYSILGLGCINGVKGDSTSAISAAIGLGKDGSFAEYIIVAADLLVPVPDGVGPEVAAIASDAGITAYRSSECSQVLIFGSGGVGHLAPAARKLTLELGATEAFDLIQLTNKTAAGFTVDTTIDFIANTQTFTLAQAALRGNDVDFPSSPTLVLVGFSADNLVFDTLNILTLGVQIRSSTYGPRSALVAALDLFAKGAVRAHVHSEPLKNVNKVIDELRAFEIVGRKVLIPHPST